MRHNVKKVTKVNTVKKVTQPVKKVKVNTIPKISKATIDKLIKIELFDNLSDDKKSEYSRLLQASRLTTVANMGLNKALKEFLTQGKEALSPKQKQLLTFKNVVEYLQTSKYKNLVLFSMHQITLLCNEYLTSVQDSVKRAKRLEKQNKAIAKK